MVRWAWLAIVVAFSFEVAARIDDWFSYRAPLFGSYVMEGLFQPTPRGWRGVPDAGFVKWKLNASGFRGPEVLSDTGQTRVIAYGASETFGIYEDTGREYPRALEDRLNSATPSRRFEVINGGMPGMRVGSGITFLYDIGRTLHPKFVVIYPTPTHYVGVTRPYCGRVVEMPKPPRFAMPKPRMVDKAKDRLKALLPPGGLTRMRELGIAWATRDQPVIQRVPAQSLDALETDLKCAIKAARDLGATPILVTHASRFGAAPRPDDDYWLTGWRLQYPEIVPQGLIDLETRANSRIQAVALQEHVKLVDAAAALSGDPANFADHAHFTNLGAGKLAALLSEAILQGTGDGQTQAGSTDIPRARLQRSRPNAPGSAALPGGRARESKSSITVSTDAAPAAASIAAVLARVRWKSPAAGSRRFGFTVSGAVSNGGARFSCPR